MKASTRAILQRRAYELARPTDVESDAETVEMLVFKLASGSYGVELEYGLELITLAELTPVPCAKPFVSGITSVRGRIVSVLDLDKLLELPSSGIVDRNKALIVANEFMEFAVLLDDVVGIMSVAEGDLQSRLGLPSEAAAPFVRGITPDGVVFLDMGLLLKEPTLVNREVVGG